MPTRTTAYNRLADALRQRILTGDWAPGQQLPTEQKLCDLFGCSRITIRRALQILEEELLVRRRQGAGTFVSPTPARKIPILNTDFFGSIARHAPDLTRRVVDHGWVEADDDKAEQLDILPGEKLLHMLRIDELRGTPVTTDEVWLLERCATRLNDTDLAELDFFEHWRQVQGITLEYATQTIEAVKAVKPWTDLLETKTGEPLLRETNIVYQSAVQRAGLFVSYYRHDFFRFDATIAIGGGRVPIQMNEVTRG